MSKILQWIKLNLNWYDALYGALMMNITIIFGMEAGVLALAASIALIASAAKQKERERCRQESP